MLKNVQQGLYNQKNFFVHADKIDYSCNEAKLKKKKNKSK